MICTRSHNTQAKTGENAAAVMTKGHERPEKKSPDSQSRAALMIEKDRKPAASQKAPRPKTAIPNGDYKTHKKLFWEKATS